MPLADSATAGTALLNALEELVLGRSKQASPDRKTPFDEDWDPMRYGSDVERAAKDIKDGADVQSTLDDAVAEIDTNIESNDGYGF